MLPRMIHDAWPPAIWPLLLVLLTPPVVAQTVENPRPRLTFQQRIGFIKKTEASSSAFSKPEDLDAYLERKLTPDERRAITRTDDGAWKTFEDDLIRFELPDDPALTVEVVEGKDEQAIQVIGSVASEADNHFDRAYHLKVKGNGGSEPLHYGVILVSKAPWFDAGLCMCGAIAYKKCLIEEGSALEVSLLHGGNIKKVQALGASHRAVLFEWTHSVIPQSAYARLGRSLRLKEASSRTLPQWHAEARKQGGDFALLPWLERGDDEKTIISLLGEPTRRDKDGQWVYIQESWQTDGSGYRYSLSFRVDPTSGYAGYGPDGQGGPGFQELPPKPDSPAWAEKRVDDADGFRTSEAEKVRIQKEDFPKIIRMFLDHAAADVGDGWERWICIAGLMTRQGWRDPRIPEAVLKRYPEKDLQHHYSAEILDAYKVEDRQKLFLARMDHILTLKDGQDQAGNEARLLLPALDPKDPATVDRVRRAFQHPDHRVRGFACGVADRLPDGEAFAALKPILADEEMYTRASAARSLARLVHAQDVPWLEERLKQETEDFVKSDLEKTIEAARSRPGPR